MMINTVPERFDVKLLQHQNQQEEKEESLSKLKQIEDAINSISKDKNHNTIDDKIKKTKKKITQREKNLSEEEVIIYFQSSISKIGYDFSYLGNLKKPVFYSHNEINLKQENNDTKTSYGEIITNNVLHDIITIQKMDTLLGTRTGFVDQNIKERFDILKKLSFYEAIIRVNYELHT